MGKVKWQAPKHTNHHDNPASARRGKINRIQSSRPQVQVKSHSTNHSTPKAPSSQIHPRPRPKVPYTRHDHILLVGEGDFSFALSLARKVKPEVLVATCFDSEEELRRKYDGFNKTLAELRQQSSRNGSKTESSNGIAPDALPSVDNTEWRGFSQSPPSSPNSPVSDEDDKDPEPRNNGHDSASRPSDNIIHTSINATKLSTTHKNVLRPHAPFSKIAFNFPHVGGLSTDVNRQVRANQELLVSFFNAAKPLLSSPTNPLRQRTPRTEDTDRYATDESSSEDEQKSSQSKNGQILVTLFEGEPYSLWNIRDLARHCGLRVIESFRFPWTEYPGYTHARTVGDIVSGKDRSEEGKRKGKWRGEEREARCFVLESKEEDRGSVPGMGRKRKRKAGEDDSGDE